MKPMMKTWCGKAFESMCVLLLALAGAWWSGDRSLIVVMLAVELVSWAVVSYRCVRMLEEGR